MCDGWSCFRELELLPLQGCTRRLCVTESCFRELELLPLQGCTRRLSVTVGHVSENWSFCHYKVVPGDCV